MSIIRFDPFADLLTNGRWVPAVDIFENEKKELVLKAELPDVKKEDVSLTVENSTLTLSGERKFDNEVKKEQYHRIERSYGSFSRSFSLPATVDSTRIPQRRQGVVFDDPNHRRSADATVRTPGLAQRVVCVKRGASSGCAHELNVTASSSAATRPTMSPPIDPSTASRRLSVISWRTSRERLAPTAIRVSISCCLLSPRASTMLPRFAQAARRTSATSGPNTKYGFRLRSSS